MILDRFAWFAVVVGLLAGCASAPPEIPENLAAPAEDRHATEALMTDAKFQDGLDAAMASGSSLEPFVKKLTTVPATDESRVLLSALLEEEAKRRPLTAPSLIVPPAEASMNLVPLNTPTPLAESRTTPEPRFWNENRVVGALIGVVALGLVLSTTNYKLVITAP